MFFVTIFQDFPLNSADIAPTLNFSWPSCWYYYYYYIINSLYAGCLHLYTGIIPCFQGIAYNVEAILWSQFMVHVMLCPMIHVLYFYISTFRSTCAVPNVAVFCSSWTSYIPGMLLSYFLKLFDIVPVSPIITGTIYNFIFHKRCTSIVKVFIF